MDIIQIKYALKVIETGNFSKAAQELFITQPSLSQQIKKLEYQLETTLFERNTRNFTLTKSGEEFATYAKEVLKAHDLLNVKMEKYKQAYIKTLKVGFFPPFSKVIPSNVVQKFISDNPDVKLAFQEEYSHRLITLLMAQKIDIAILRDNVIDPKFKKELISIPVYDDEIHVICNEHHPLANRKSVTLEDVELYPIVKPYDKSALILQLKGIFKAASIQPNFVCECPDTNNMIAMVSNGIGISFVSKKIFESYYREGLKLIKLNPKISSNTQIVYLKNNLKTSIISQFVNYMENNLL